MMPLLVVLMITFGAGAFTGSVSFDTSAKSVVADPTGDLPSEAYPTPSPTPKAQR